MRGEDWQEDFDFPGEVGSPPHARGRLNLFHPRDKVYRITPACAGKTMGRPSTTPTYMDHPRMRGEDRWRGILYRSGFGSPPHARGRQFSDYAKSKPSRITPACAGKTLHMGNPPAVDRDHPRMRGEDISIRQFLGVVLGSPPHARGRRRLNLSKPLIYRITPACAGKTAYRSWQEGNSQDHPRMRGEDTPAKKPRRKKPGSPPHARGRLLRKAKAVINTRITPACAGKTDRCSK